MSEVDNNAPAQAPAESAAAAPAPKPALASKPGPSAKPPKPAPVILPPAPGASLGDDLTQAGMNWFTLRVASNKENSVRETLLRKVQIEGMTHLVGRILVPTEKTKTIKGGKQKITETKLYPGYVFVEMRLEPDGRIPQDVFFLIKETTGVGDFVGTAGRPTPLKNHEIEKLHKDSRKPEEEPEIKLVFAKGEHVVIKEGPFQGYEGTVDELVPDKGKVRVLVTIFGRQAPIEIEEWLIGKSEHA